MTARTWSVNTGYKHRSTFVRLNVLQAQLPVGVQSASGLTFITKDDAQAHHSWF